MPIKKRKKESGQTRMAAAIRYDSARDDAPRLTAKGKGHVAEKIIELARQHNIPIRTDRALVHILSKLDLDQHIPPDLYRAVAEILAFVYSANEQYREKQGPGKGERIKATGTGCRQQATGNRLQTTMPRAQKTARGKNFPTRPKLPAQLPESFSPLVARNDQRKNQP